MPSTPEQQMMRLPRQQLGLISKPHVHSRYQTTQLKLGSAPAWALYWCPRSWQRADRALKEPPSRRAKGESK